MKFTVLTLFPEMYQSFRNVSIVKRALQKQKAVLEIINIRDFSEDKHHHVDDTPYGGGAGMLLQVGPIDRALKSVRCANSYVMMTTPKAKPLTQKDVRRLSKKEHIILLCGHYEGVDERVNDYIDENFSIGEYILTGGELPSCVLMDAIIRLLDGTISKDSLTDESYDHSLLEYPQYTKPRVYQGKKVPSVLLSGNHALIQRWRKKMALFDTLRYRPDLLKKQSFSDTDKELLHEIYVELKTKN